MAFFGSALLGRPLLALYAQRLYPIPPTCAPRAPSGARSSSTSAAWLCGHTPARRCCACGCWRRLPLELYLVPTRSPAGRSTCRWSRSPPGIRCASCAGRASCRWRRAAERHGRGRAGGRRDRADDGMNDDEERELKLVPERPALLDRLAAVDAAGRFRGQPAARAAAQQLLRLGVAARSRRRSRLPAAHGRGPAAGQRGRSRPTASRCAAWPRRAEIELQLDADTPPALALGALREAARKRGARRAGRGGGDALAAGGPPLAKPFLETETDRRIVDLAKRSSAAGRSSWRSTACSSSATPTRRSRSKPSSSAATKQRWTRSRRRSRALGEVRESDGTKLSRALGAPGDVPLRQRAERASGAARRAPRARASGRSCASRRVRSSSGNAARTASRRGDRVLVVGSRRPAGPRRWRSATARAAARPRLSSRLTDDAGRPGPACGRPWPG